MRIIRGKYRGHVIHTPKNLRVRPTTEIAREALFNILEHQVILEGLSVLDLFAGTGAISYEFASRGAGTIHLVEQNETNFRFILKVIRELDLSTIRAFRRDVFTYLKKCTDQYDLIFADPPYRAPHIERLPEIICSSGILRSGGVFILEHSDNYSFRHIPEFVTEKKYSQVHFSIFEKKGNPLPDKKA